MKQTHNYYHQIQGQMYLSGRSQCHMVIWSPHECVTLLISKDPTWEANLAKLSDFYYDMYLPRFMTEFNSLSAVATATSSCQHD